MTRIRFTDDFRNSMNEKELDCFDFEIGRILSIYEECCEASGEVLLYASTLSTIFSTDIGIIETSKCCGLTRSKKISIPNEEIKSIYRDRNILMLIDSEWKIIDVD